MMGRGRFIAVIAAAALAAVAVAAGAVVLTGGEETTDLMPNLDQAEPGELSGSSSGTAGKLRFFLGFASAAGNVGDGPVVIVGKRRTVAEPEMRLVQQISRSDGSIREIPLRATLRYVRSPTHSHWHLLGFMRYELRAANGRRVRRDRKTGFCLGDRYKLSLSLPRSVATARFPDECGKGHTRLLTLREGISVGWGDDYKPHLEGQEFDVTTLPAGKYLLVHRVNPDRVLRESDYSDNASSMAFQLTWARGRELPPRVDVIARCPASATCP